MTRATDPTLRRRSVLTGALGVGLAGTAVGGGHAWHRRTHAPAPRYGASVAMLSLTERTTIDDPAGLVPGTRVAVGTPFTATLVEREEAWLERAAEWTREDSPHGRLLESALRDLYVLSTGLPIPVAGWPPLWRYAWPRDTAHVVRAWHQIGREDLVRAHLLHLSDLVGDRPLAARYRLTGGRPDARPDQLDGPGFVLWAVMSTSVSWRGTAEHPAIVSLARHCAEQLLGALGDAALPPVGPDYWEVEAREVTLGVAATMLVGLESAARGLAEVGWPLLAERCQEAASRVAAGIEETFMTRGYPRHVSGGQRDAAITFLMPPYRDPDTVGDPLREALRAATNQMMRGNGGLAPGGGWKGDGVAWTPETLLVARADAGMGLAPSAHAWLQWIDRHRSPLGSIPEKVRWDGSSAGPAPLAWSAALVVDTVAALRHQDSMPAGA